MHVYSALPIVEAETRYLIAPQVPSMHMRVRLRSGRELEMHFVHPAPPSPTENDTSRKRDAELATVGREVADSNWPVVVAGDLNDVAWSRTTRRFKRISGLVDPRRGRGMFNTFDARYPFLRFPLDHVFHSAGFSLVTMQRLSSIGSDHFRYWSNCNWTSRVHDRSGSIRRRFTDRTDLPGFDGSHVLSQLKRSAPCRRCRHAGLCRTDLLIAC